MIKSASRLATRIKNTVERKKEQELFLRIAESKASRLTEVFLANCGNEKNLAWLAVSTLSVALFFISQPGD